MPVHADYNESGGKGHNQLYEENLAKHHLGGDTYHDDERPPTPRRDEIFDSLQQKASDQRSIIATTNDEVCRLVVSVGAV